MSNKDLPSHDFYQNSNQLTLSIYIKGYGIECIKENVKVELEKRKIIIDLPQIPSAEARKIVFEPLFDDIVVESSTSRILNTKIEIKLTKSNPINWSTLLSDPNKPLTSSSHSHTQSTVSVQSPNTNIKGEYSNESLKANQPIKSKKNWDKLLEDELEEKEDNKDPNSGGDAALQKFFSQIYGNADDDTKRAMIKSFTESGGTTLSTDWNNISKGIFNQFSF
uniref:SGS domain-containing protein n=1 Tax=Kwoniella pini CBS 10737 TaxID=1296096 RepID=A0A1B9HSH4_9TREE|nr:uncharacterized protein I206_07857 [Kwoniella pini CBS 10737]OCF46187.1 hypothetical protein I206_07857 [Kwoniella pini CBS 10737]